MGIWHYFVPIAQRRRMRELDQQYRRLVDKTASKEKLLEKPDFDRSRKNNDIV